MPPIFLFLFHLGLSPGCHLEEEDSLETGL
jgi:hypothetical protein